MEEVKESLADRLNREEEERPDDNIVKFANRSTVSGLKSDNDILNLNKNAESESNKVTNENENQTDANDYNVRSKDGNNVVSEKIAENINKLHEDVDSSNTADSGSEVCQAKTDKVMDSVEDNSRTVNDGNSNIENLGAESFQTKRDNCEDTKGDNEDEFVDVSEDSGSDVDYESAEEGEEIQLDKENLNELEKKLTDEEKEERRNTAQKLKEEGNDLFRCGSYKSAIRIYSRALRTCPLKYAKDRAIMYSNRGACKMRLEDFEECIRDCSKALDLHPQYMKALMRRAELYEKTDKLDEALVDYQKIVELDPSQHTARAACLKLPDQIKERNEKLKEEMMGKLKDLGNMVLRPFGLSTNNFQMKQDPTSGGYSVNFVQNPDQK